MERERKLAILRAVGHGDSHAAPKCHRTAMCARPSPAPLRRTERIAIGQGAPWGHAHAVDALGRPPRRPCALASCEGRRGITAGSGNPRTGAVHQSWRAEGPQAGAAREGPTRSATAIGGLATLRRRGIGLNTWGRRARAGASSRRRAQALLPRLLERIAFKHVHSWACYHARMSAFADHRAAVAALDPHATIVCLAGRCHAPACYEQVSAPQTRCPTHVREE